VQTLDGEDERELVRQLLALKTGLAEVNLGAGWSETVGAARDRVMALVNEFFRDRLMAVASIEAYMREMSE
jgi:hypothetical protein